MTGRVRRLPQCSPACESLATHLPDCRRAIAIDRLMAQGKTVAEVMEASRASRPRHRGNGEGLHGNHEKVPE